ncbi:BID domain-containing T4SS effector [Bartonella gliris]|uniref:BID domain-containing T4SS effector n=1 Tax=Bartonella gliris TaxID=3004109 RepID=UPI003872CB55
MKKHQSPPSPQTPPEALYAQVNKPSRGPRPQQPKEPVYAEINTGANGSPHHTQPEEVVYATIGMGASGGPRPQHPTEPVYADVHVAGRGHHPHRPEETVYADVHVGGRGRHPHRPEQSAHAAGTSQHKGGPLTNVELAAQLSENVDVQYCRAEVRHWAKIVYGNSGAFEQQISGFLRHPHAGDPISRATAENPENVGKLAGTQTLGIKSPARKQAEDGFRPLCDALERFEQTANKLAQNIIRKHQEKHKDLERGQENPERTHRHHHHHRAREEQHHSPQREAQQRSRAGEQKRMAFGM